MSDRCVVVVPARWGSSRLPGKPLRRIGGVPLVEHVWRGVAGASGVSEVLVATDDVRIADAVRGVGGTAVLTGPCVSGTHRVAEAIRDIDAGWVVNVQGDLLGVESSHVETVAGMLRGGADMATLAAPLPAGTTPDDRSLVKVEVGEDGRAVRFSRTPVPTHGPWLVHVGIYGFTRAALECFVGLPETPLARAEDLEQLRWLESGRSIDVGLLNNTVASIDTMTQLREAQSALRRRTHTRVRRSG